MYQEIDVIDGVLCWRGTPNGKWIKFSIEEITSRLVEAQTTSNTAYAQCQELLEECFDVIGTSKLCTKAIYHKLLRHFA